MRPAARPALRPAMRLTVRLCALYAGLSLAACSHVDRTVAISPVPSDYHERHPVVLANARTDLDIFLLGARTELDYRQKHDVQAFSADYLAHGQGLVRILVPRAAGPGAGGMPGGAAGGRAVGGGDADATLVRVQRALAASGVKGEIEVGNYTVDDPKLAAALRLSFVKLQARAASHCGDWPGDLGSGASLDGWENRSYYNLGCATQQTLAAQMDDPRDLIRPRAEDPSDVQMRTRSIQDLRGAPSAPVGFDPSTAWGTHIISNTSGISN